MNSGEVCFQPNLTARHENLIPLVILLSIKRDLPVPVERPLTIDHIRRRAGANSLQKTTAIPYLQMQRRSLQSATQIPACPT